MFNNGKNKTVGRNAGWYAEKWKRCTGKYAFTSQKPGYGVLGGLFTDGGLDRNPETMWYTFNCDNCGHKIESSDKRNPGRCHWKWDIADPRGINILCRKEDVGTYSLIWDTHGNAGWGDSYLSANNIRNLKDAPADDVFGTVKSEGRKWIATSPLTEQVFRFKNRTLAITRLRNHLRNERLM